MVDLKGVVDLRGLCVGEIVAGAEAELVLEAAADEDGGVRPGEQVLRLRAADATLAAEWREVLHIACGSNIEM